jgi:bifunctional UDP-N-acetylglucosamine pyrophosphorylase / glucosamine-1-phosphate N-acetyltransferase
MFSPIIEQAEVPLVSYNTADWTAIVPAAGRGSRLQSSMPKILYPVLGRPIASWLVELLQPVCQDVVFVLSPDGRPRIEPVLRALNNRILIAIQDEPRGMGDAVLQSEMFAKTRNVLVIWGDQIAFRTRSLLQCIVLHQSRANAILTMPTVIRSNPYINLVRDKNDVIIEVQQARENEIASDVGENDCGIFLFNRDALFRLLHESIGGEVLLGKKTKEFNLLQILPLCEQGRGSVMTMRLNDPSETLGINTVDDALLIVECLKSRRA